MLWLLRMRRWVQNPPSARMVRLGLVVIGLSFALFVYETYFGWPEWLTVNEHGRRMLRP